MRDTVATPLDGAPLPGPWWRSAAIYQIYPRSFADGNGDGVGDLAGVRAHLSYLAALGSTRCGSTRGTPRRWPTPATTWPTTARSTRSSGRWPKPRRSSRRRTRWASASSSTSCRTTAPTRTPGSSRRSTPARGRRLGTCSGSAPAGATTARLPPNNWSSIFGGPAWTRTKNPDGTDGEWYLHLFAPGQPDLNWENPVVHQEFEDVLRFWFDRGRRRRTHRLGRAAHQGPAAWPTSTRPTRRCRTRSPTGMRCTRCTGPGADRRELRPSHGR